MPKCSLCVHNFAVPWQTVDCATDWVSVCAGNLHVHRGHFTIVPLCSHFKCFGRLHTTATHTHKCESTNILTGNNYWIISGWTHPVVNRFRKCLRYTFQRDVVSDRCANQLILYHQHGWNYMFRIKINEQKLNSRFLVFYGLMKSKWWLFSMMFYRHSNELHFPLISHTV